MVQDMHISPKALRKETLCRYSTFREIDRMANGFRVPSFRDNPQLQLALTTSTEAAASLLQAICLQEPR